MTSALDNNTAVNPRTNRPDPLALAVADAVQRSVTPARVILFGSRARGDYRSDSDIDLMVITDAADTTAAELKAKLTARECLRLQQTDIGVDVVTMTVNAFRRACRANQHVAGQAYNQGIWMSTESLDNIAPEPDGYPDHWPETVRRLQTVEEWLYHVNDMLDQESGPQRVMGFGAQQAVENALKAWLSTHNLQRNYGHDLMPLWDEVRNLPETSTPDAATAITAVDDLFAYTRYETPELPGVQLDWLSKYAVDYRYAGVSYAMTASERAEFKELLNIAVSAIVALVHQRSGTTPADVWPEGVRPW